MRNRMAALTARRTFKTELENGTLVSRTITTTVNQSPEKTQCLTDGCKGIAGSGEWLCPDCLAKFSPEEWAVVSDSLNVRTIL